MRIFVTNGLNGTKTDQYQNHIAQMNFYINHHFDVPSFNNQEITLQVGEKVKPYKIIMGAYSFLKLIIQIL